VVLGRWDKSGTRGGCQKFMDIYDRDIFTESNLQALKARTFNVTYPDAKVIEYARGK
jgi:hypothetical protein